MSCGRQVAWTSGVMAFTAAAAHVAHDTQLAVAARLVALPHLEPILATQV